MSEVKLHSVITCPTCGYGREETMPTDTCLFYWECPGCGESIRPRPGDCCVYGSYGTVPYPPVQVEGEGGGCG